MTTTPFADTALEYLERSWCPIPVRGKGPPPEDLTGRSGRDYSMADIIDLSSNRPDDNIATRAPLGVIGIDVDDYDEKEGMTTFSKAYAKWGPLPPTVRSSARGVPSGIYWYRVPADYEAVGMLQLDGTKDVEIIQRHHRYAVLPPSIHPKLGEPYRWYDTDGKVLDEIPRAEDLPKLPEPWLEGLRAQNFEVVEREPIEVQPKVAPRDGWHERVDAAFRQMEHIARSKAGSRHDTMVSVVMTMCRMEADGLDGATSALQEAERTWIDAMSDDRGRDAAREEWARALNGGRNLASTTEPADAWTKMGRAVAQSFYDARATLGHIRTAAHARGLPADAVLGCVLARMAYLTAPELKIPAMVGSVGSLDVIHAIVAPSGMGKSQSMRCARDLLPGPDSEVDGLPIGSGEGLIEAYYGLVEVEGENGKKRKERQRKHKAVLFEVDEGQILAELAQRSGSTLMTNLRSAWSGGNVGQTNATADRTRLLKANSYRFALVVGIQPEKADMLLGDATGGTPQRFCWFSGVDKTLPRPDDWPEWPGRLAWKGPSKPAMGTWEFDVAKPIWSEVRNARYELATTGDSTLESHALLLKLKLSGLLALLEGRITVDVSDWLLADEIYTSSTATRDAMSVAIAAERSAKAQSKGYASAMERLAEEEVMETKVIRSMAGSIARKVWSASSPISHREAVQATNGRHRKIADPDDAIDFALEEGWVQMTEDATIAPGHRPPPA